MANGVVSQLVVSHPVESDNHMYSCKGIGDSEGACTGAPCKPGVPLEVKDIRDSEGDCIGAPLQQLT